jgi:hypothetical protein
MLTTGAVTGVGVGVDVVGAGGLPPVSEERSAAPVAGPTIPITGSLHVR